MTDIIQLIIALIASGFFSGSEIALLSASRLQVEVDAKRGGPRGRMTSFFVTHPTRFIGTMLMGNTIALVWLGITTAKILDPWLQPHMSDGLTVFVETILSTIVVLFVAEYIPKSLFRARANELLRALAWPLMLFVLVLWPVVSVLSGISVWLIRRSGQDIDNRSHPNVFGKADLDHYVEEAASGPEQEPEVELFRNALEFDEVKVRQCMVPRTEVAAVKDDISLSDLEAEFADKGYSKLLVFRDSIDDAYAYVHAFGLFRRPRQVKDILTPLIYLPETMGAQEAFKTIIREKRSMALVLDEHGSPSGMVTVEDIVEELFGEIDDEHDDIKPLYELLDNGAYRLDASLEIEALNDDLGFDWPEDDAYTTVGGLVSHHLGRLPEVGDELALGPWDIIIEVMDAQRIASVTVTKAEV